MNGSNFSFILIALFLAILNAALAYGAWRHRCIPGRIFALILLLAASWWSLGIALQFASLQISWQLVWTRLQVPAAATLPTLWMLFVLYYTNLNRLLPSYSLFLLAVEPVFATLLAWSQLSPALLAGQETLSASLYALLGQPPGFVGWLHMGYTVILGLLSGILLVRNLINRHNGSRNLVLAAIGAGLIISVSICLEAVGFDPFSPLPLVPIALPAAGVGIGLVLIALRLFGLEQRASQAIFEHISDAVIVLDNSNRIVNINQAAEKLIGRQASSIIGQRVKDAWPNWPNEITWPFGTASVDQETTINCQGAPHSFTLHISPLSGARSQLRGRVIVLHDTTVRKRTEETLRRRDEILDAIGFATRQFMRHAALEEILPEVFARLGEAARVSRVYLLENQFAADGSITSIYRHEWDAVKVKPQLKIPVLQAFSMPERGLGRWVSLLSTGKVINDLIPNLPESERLFLQERDVCSVVVVPIFLEEKWWGSLGFEDCKTEREWSELEIDVLRTAADTIGASLQRRRAEEAAHRWADVIQTLLDLTVVIGSTMNIHQVLERVLLAVRTLLPVDRAAILLWDEQQNALLPTRSSNGNGTQSEWPAEVVRDFSQFKLTPDNIPLIRELQQRKEAVAIQTAANSPLLPVYLVQMFRITSLLAVPICYHDRFTAVLYADYTHNEHSFTRQEIDLATALARQAGLAIERARLYTQSQEDADELSALYQASSTLLTTGNNLQALADHITEVVTGEFDFAYCSVLLVDKEQNHLVTIAQRGFADNNDLPLPLDGPGLTVQAALSGEIVYAPDVTKAARYLAGSSQTRSEIVIPLKAGEEVLGLLNLESPEPAAFDDRARRILTAFADDAALAIQNVRLFSEAQTHARQMALLNEITRTALLKTEIHEMLNALSNQMNELIHSDKCYITLWDEQRQQVTLGGASENLTGLFQHWAPEPWQPTLTAAVLAARKPITVPDVQNTSYVLPKLNGNFPFHTLLGLPMIVGENKLGAVLIGFTQPHTFTSREISICQQASGQIALAIAEARSLESAQLRAQEAETLRQAGSIVASTLKEDEAIQLIMEQLARVVPCDSASVQILHNGYLEIVGGYGWPDNSPVIGLRFPVPGTNPNTEVIQQRQPVLLGDVSPTYTVFHDSPHSQIRSWLGVPLVLHDQVMGMLAMDSNQPDYFTHDQARLASAFADQVAIIMENARLYQQARQAAERRTVLHRVSQEIVTANPDPEQIYAAIHRAAVQLMPTEAFVITLITPDITQAEAVYLIDRDGRSPRQLFPKEQGLTGRVLAAGKTIYIPDVEQAGDIEGTHFGSQEYTRSILALPLRAGDRIIGMLSTQTYQPNAYTTEDQYLLEMLAATAAIAIENSRLLKEIQWLAITDPLTGLYNRRGLFELAEREVERFRRFNRPFCVYMLDIDHFKQINDTYGHTAGDQVLIELAHRLRRQIRDVDIICRYGGEEILVVLPETQIPHAMQVAERARLTVQELPIPTERGEIPVTISIGLAQIDATIPDLATLVDRADSAMYAAKQAGRNQVMAYQEQKEEIA